LPVFLESRWYPDDPVYEKFKIVLDRILKHALEVKISLIGEAGVGKSTIIKLLSHQDPMTPPVPTVGVSIEKLKFELGSTHITMWDFSGQPQYRDLWKTQIHKSDLVLLVLDSTTSTVQSAPSQITEIKTILPNTPLYIVANKQDLPNKITPVKIARTLGVPTFGLIAININYRKKLVKFLENAISPPQSN